MRLLHISQQLRPDFIPASKTLRKLTYLPVSLNGCFKKACSEGTFRYLQRTFRVSSGLIVLLEPVQKIGTAVLLDPFLYQLHRLVFIFTFAEDISYFKDIEVINLFCFRQRLLQPSSLEQPIDKIIVTLHLSTEAQERLII